jgi:hypothetical protein
MIVYMIVAVLLTFLMALTVINSAKISKQVGRFNLTVLKYATICSLCTFKEVWQRVLSNIIPCNTRFINNTTLPNSVLENAWTEAQNEIGTTSFPLNVFAANTQPQSPDPRAFQLRHFV